jgi:Type IV secretion-system coupling protein DNA-binding domain
MALPESEPPSYFARSNFRNQGTLFGIKQADRLSHMYVIGKTGTGKSTLLQTLALQDIAQVRGMMLIDPHGDLAERIMGSIPPTRRDDVIYFNVPDPKQPFGYNPLKHVREDKIPLAASGLMEAFEKMWPDAWGVRMEHVLRNALLALLEQPDATLPDILRLLNDKEYRAAIVDRLRNDQVQRFWRDEYDHYPPRLKAEAIAPIPNKVGAFLADPILRRILTSPGTPIHFRRIMDEGKILIVNLARGQVGEDTASLLGALLVTTAALAAFSRAEVPEATRRPFLIYLDEFQSFTTRSLATMTAELRKYGIGVIAAHQYLTQVEPPVIDAVLGNAGTIIAFRLGPRDALALSGEFQPKFGQIDLANLPNHEIYLKLMIDGAPSQPFSAVTIQPSELEVPFQ